MAADGKTPPTHPQGGGGNIMCTCSYLHIVIPIHGCICVTYPPFGGGGGGEPGGAGSYIGLSFGISHRGPTLGSGYIQLSPDSFHKFGVC